MNILVIRPKDDTPLIRSDNGLIFQSQWFREACALYRLGQEYITPYTLEQNGLIERWFRSGTLWVQEACMWQHTFERYAEAKLAVRAWIT